jgi:hypothetical protein
MFPIIITFSTTTLVKTGTKISRPTKTPPKISKLNVPLTTS